MDVEYKKFERIVKKLNLDGELVGIRPLMGGISAQMTALDIVQSNDETITIVARFPSEKHVQKNPHVVADEFNLLHALHKAGLVVPQPYLFDQSGEIFPRPYWLMSYVDGEMGLNPVDKLDCVRQYAEQLVHIHKVDISEDSFSFLTTFGKNCERQNLVTERPFHDAFREEEICQQLSSYRLKDNRNTAVLLHGDYWPGNTLWRDGKLVAVIDWEDAQMGDPLIDLAQARSELVWIWGIEAMQRFTNDYLSQMDIDVTQLPYWDLCATLRFLSILGDDLPGVVDYFGKYGRYDITEQSITSDYAWFIEQALTKLNT